MAASAAMANVENAAGLQPSGVTDPLYIVRRPVGTLTYSGTRWPKLGESLSRVSYLNLKTGANHARK